MKFYIEQKTINKKIYDQNYNEKFFVESKTTLTKYERYIYDSKNYEELIDIYPANSAITNTFFIKYKNDIFEIERIINLTKYEFYMRKLNWKIEQFDFKTLIINNQNKNICKIKTKPNFSYEIDIFDNKMNKKYIMLILGVCLVIDLILINNSRRRIQSTTYGLKEYFLK